MDIYYNLYNLIMNRVIFLFIGLLQVSILLGQSTKGISLSDSSNQTINKVEAFTLDKQKDKPIRRNIVLDLKKIIGTLSNAPMEFSARAKGNPLKFQLPLPDGSDITFNIVESPIMTKDFAALYPTINGSAVIPVGTPFTLNGSGTV